MSLLYSILSKPQHWQCDNKNNQMIFSCPIQYQDWFKSTFVFLELLNFKPYCYNGNLTLSPFDYKNFISQTNRLKYLRSQPIVLRYLCHLNFWKTHTDPSIMVFKVSDVSARSLETLKNYFDEHHITYTQQNKHIHISKYDYIRLYKNLNGFKSLIPAIKYKTDCIAHLTSKEWCQNFKHTKLFGRLFSDASYYREELYQSAIEHPINTFVLKNNQFLTLINQDFLKTPNMYIDSSTDTNKRLDEINALGFYSWPGDFINLHTQTLHNHDFISTLLHEINHRTQFLSELEYDSFAINQVMEASSTAISIINDLEQPYDKIYDDCFDFIEKNLDKDVYKKYLLNTNLAEQRLFSLDYLIKAEAEFKMHQCITEMYLAKDRAMLYDVMLKHNISLDNNDFNDLCDDIDYWKKYNLNHYITLSKYEKYPKKNKSILTEMFHLNIETSPEALFTADTLKELNYQTNNRTLGSVQLSYMYKGITPDFISEAEKDFNCGNINALNKKFHFIQKLNPILNSVVLNDVDYLMAQDVLNVFYSMADKKPITTVLSHLNYNITDKLISIHSEKKGTVQIRNTKQR